MNLEKKEQGKENPIVKRIRWRLFRSLNQMPSNIFNEYNGLPRVLLFEPGGSSAEVLLHGGKVVSWKNKHGEELLFMSRKVFGRSPKEIKGGLSVCFPQFGNLGALNEHCSSSSNTRSIDNCPLHLIPTGNPSSVDLILKTSTNDITMWPRSFELRLRVSLGPGTLTLIPRVRNTDNKSFSFTFALRNYLSVSDISEVRVEGLETLDYRDNLLQGKRFTEQPDAITFDDEVDRVYMRTPANIAIIDHKKKRTIVLHKEGLPDAVLWNPWEKSAKSLSCFGDKDYQVMLSMDSAVLEKPIFLRPSKEWNGYQQLSTVSSSYFSGQLDPEKVLNGVSRLHSSESMNL